MSTFLQLVQTVHRECAVSGSSPASVVNQSGMYNKLVNWTADAEYEIQAKWADWDFLWSQWTEETIVDTARYSAPADLGSWDRESFYLDYSTATAKQLFELDYRKWRETYRQGVLTSHKPDYFIIEPDRGIRLHSPPDAVYSLTADYWRKPVRLAANADTPTVPVEFERTIIALAKMKYAEDQGAGVVMMNAQLEYLDWMDQLQSAQLPHQGHRRQSSPPPMVVIPE